MPLPADLLSGLEEMPRELERVLVQFPHARLTWKPDAWAACPSETFSALEHVCHLRDVERDGYHVRIRRMLDESHPSLASLDGYEMARARSYDSTPLDAALASFREARALTMEEIRHLSDAQLTRTGVFAEYGRLTLGALIHYLRSHDLQHLAGLQWLAGKLASAH